MSANQFSSLIVLLRGAIQCRVATSSIEIIKEVGLVITPDGVYTDTHDDEEFKGKDEDMTRPEETSRSIY